MPLLDLPLELLGEILKYKEEDTTSLSLVLAYRLVCRKFNWTIPWSFKYKSKITIYTHNLTNNGIPVFILKLHTVTGIHSSHTFNMDSLLTYGTNGLEYWVYQGRFENAAIVGSKKCYEDVEELSNFSLDHLLSFLQHNARITSFSNLSILAKFRVDRRNVDVAIQKINDCNMNFATSMSFASSKYPRDMRYHRSIVLGQKINEIFFHLRRYSDSIPLFDAFYLEHPNTTIEHLGIVGGKIDNSSLFRALNRLGNSVYLLTLECTAVFYDEGDRYLFPSWLNRVVLKSSMIQYREDDSSSDSDSSSFSVNDSYDKTDEEESGYDTDVHSDSSDDESSDYYFSACSCSSSENSDRATPGIQCQIKKFRIDTMDQLFAFRRLTGKRTKSAEDIRYLKHITFPILKDMILRLFFPYENTLRIRHLLSTIKRLRIEFITWGQLDLLETDEFKYSQIQYLELHFLGEIAIPQYIIDTILGLPRLKKLKITLQTWRDSAKEKQDRALILKHCFYSPYLPPVNRVDDNCSYGVSILFEESTLAEEFDRIYT